MLRVVGSSLKMGKLLFNICGFCAMLYSLSQVLSILVPRGRAPFGQHQESRPLAESHFLSVRREFFSYSQPIGFVRFDSGIAQSDGRSMNSGLPVLDLPRGRDPGC